MTSITIGGVDITAKVVKYNHSTKKIEDNANSFTTADGTTHRNILAVKNILSISCENLNDTLKGSLSTALSASTISVSYGGVSGTFYGDESPFELLYVDGDGVNHWDLSFNLEEV